jgi:hypothetical protein
MELKLELVRISVRSLEDHSRYASSSERTPILTSSGFSSMTPVNSFNQGQ